MKINKKTLKKRLKSLTLKDSEWARGYEDVDYLHRLSGKNVV